jgi:KDO2-lipid IV(A) lauroyltransferase
LNASDPLADTAQAITPERRAELPRAWTRHGLNSGLIFGATCYGVSRFPRRLSYALGDGGTWLAWRLMPKTRASVVANLRAIFPEDSDGELRRRALLTFRCYARDVVDFLRALRAPDDEMRAMFQFKPEGAKLFDDLLARGRGIILVSGHYGNWEVGAVFLRRVFDHPLTIVAMTEASAKVNQIRRDIRDELGAETIEVRKSLDTALQIRRHLADNRIVAMLMDRHVGRDRVEVNLLGQPASFLRTPPLMGFLTGAPVLPCFIERTGPARFMVTPGEPIVVDTALPRDTAIQRAAQHFADQLSAHIRAHPSYWYHFYSYWTAPQDTADQSA